MDIEKKKQKNQSYYCIKMEKPFRKAWMMIPMVKYTKVIAVTIILFESKGYEVEGYPFQKVFRRNGQ
jgi:hypothetical protein